MKQRISISILLSILILVLTLLAVKFYYDEQPDIEHISTERDIQDISDSIIANEEYSDCNFYVKDDSGRLTVYYAKNDEIYMQTGIETKVLSEELKKYIQSGIYFKTEAELYDFLESYSS